MTANYRESLTKLSKEEVALEYFKAAYKGDATSILESIAQFYRFKSASDLVRNQSEFCNEYLEALAEETIDDPDMRKMNFRKLINYEPAIKFVKSISLENDEWWETYIRDDDALVGENRDELPERELFEYKEDIMEENMNQVEMTETEAPKKKGFKAFVKKIFSPFTALIKKIKAFVNRMKTRATTNKEKALAGLRTFWEHFKTFASAWLIPIVGMMIVGAILFIAPTFQARAIVGIASRIVSERLQKAFLCVAPLVLGCAEGYLAAWIESKCITLHLVTLYRKGSEKTRNRIMKFINFMNEHLPFIMSFNVGDDMMPEPVEVPCGA